MCRLTFHTENGKHVAEVASLLAEMSKKVACRVVPYPLIVTKI